MAEEQESYYPDEIVKACEVALRPHEEEDHAGEICHKERANLIAWLMHRLGVRDKQSLVIVLDRLVWYEEQHEEHADHHHDHEPERN